MVKLVILAYDEGKVHIYSVKKGLQYEDYEDLVDKFGHYFSNCHWILVDSDEQIINH
jgi:hypothetical protein